MKAFVVLTVLFCAAVFATETKERSAGYPSEAGQELEELMPMKFPNPSGGSFYPPPPAKGSYVPATLPTFVPDKNIPSYLLETSAPSFYPPTQRPYPPPPAPTPAPYIPAQEKYYPVHPVHPSPRPIPVHPPMVVVEPTYRPTYPGPSYPIPSYSKPSYTLEDSIPGVPGKDYPIYSVAPPASYKCSSQYPGFYADIKSGCQAWHYCQLDGRQDTFLCPNGTIFNQKYFVCDWWYNVDCAQSEAFYALNANLYKEPEKPNYGGGHYYPPPGHSSVYYPESQQHSSEEFDYRSGKKH